MTVTVTLPVAVNVHDSVDAPDPPVTDVALSEQPALSLVNETALVKPFNGETVIIDVPGDPTTVETVVGFAEIEKSGAASTANVTVVECEREPLVPVIVTTTVPVVVKVQESVEVPEPPVIEVEDRVHAALSVARATVFVNPFRGATVMVDVPGEFTAIATDVGFAVTVKSGADVTVNDTTAV